MNKKNLTRVAGLSAAAMLALSGMAMAETTESALVKGGALNLRETASLDAKVLGQYPTGTLVEIIKAGSEWHRVSVNGKTGYMLAKYLNSADSAISATVRTNTGTGLNLREQLIREVEIIPLEVVCRNVAAGSLAQRFGLPEGQALPRSIIEFFLKDDKLHDPMVTEEHITAFNWASTQEIDDMMALTLRVNDFLTGLLLGVGITLVDFKLEFGRLWENEEMRIVLADEISPDNCRLWDAKTGEKMDKDRFRRDLGKVEEGYQEVARRLGILPEAGPRDMSGPESMQ